MLNTRDYSLNINNVINRDFLTRHFAHDDSSKAGGIDGINKQLGKAAPKQLARHAHPFITKVALRVNEPLEDKGGLAHVLYKKAGATNRVASYRNIMFENGIIKHHHKFLRSRYSHLLQTC